MKLFFLLGCFLPFHILSAQTGQPLGGETFELINPEKPAYFPGGEAEMLKFIYSNFRPQPISKETQRSGSKLVISFTVDTLGNLGDFQILKEMGGGYGNEFIRVMQTMPCWIPGELNGRKIKTKMTLPLRVRFE